jgi:hypothetical protein
MEVAVRKLLGLEEDHSMILETAPLQTLLVSNLLVSHPNILFLILFKKTVAKSDLRLVMPL